MWWRLDVLAIIAFAGAVFGVAGVFADFLSTGEALTVILASLVCATLSRNRD